MGAPIFLGVSMIGGILLGIASAFSAVLTVSSAPKRLRMLIVDHPFITDLTVAMCIWFLLSAVSQSALSAVGAAIAGLLISVGLLILRVHSSARDFFTSI